LELRAVRKISAVWARLESFMLQITELSGGAVYVSADRFFLNSTGP
jgi:hypothetical protein